MQRSQSIADLIRELKVPLFGTLKPDDLAAIVPRFNRRKFLPNALVFSKGDRADELFVILSGRMKISVLAPDGRELAFRTAGPGEIVGEIAVLDGGPRTADMTSPVQTEVLTIGKPSLMALMSDRPSITQELIQFLCQRLRTTSDQLESIALYRIEARLARFLLALCGQVQPSSSKVAISLVMSQTELGAVLGASRSKVNVALSNLADTGAIRRSGSRVTCDIEKLHAIAEEAS
jgi:CRP/FNR family cyclic AMP-dependent transcriptional regulator